MKNAKHKALRNRIEPKRKPFGYIPPRDKKQKTPKDPIIPKMYH